MARLSKAAAESHQKACELLKHEHLSFEDRDFVLENWQESASHINSIAGAFFTPYGVAQGVAMETPLHRNRPTRVLDLCAGIGMLSFALEIQASGNPIDLTCLELNPDYTAVGRKIMPHARWVTASAFDLPNLDLGHFDIVISNPPFGNLKSVTDGKTSTPRFSMHNFDLKIVDLASDYADFGVFVLPAESTPFRYSGRPDFTIQRSRLVETFEAQTGIAFEFNCGFDCSIAIDEWRGAKPKVEIVTANFVAARARRLKTRELELV